MPSPASGPTGPENPRKGLVEPEISAEELESSPSTEQVQTASADSGPTGPENP